VQTNDNYKYDWIAIKNEYLNSDKSEKYLADKYGVSRSAIQKRMSKEKWVDERKKCAKSTAKKVIKKTSSKIASSLSSSLAKELRASDMITNQIIKIMEGESQLYRNKITRTEVIEGKETTWSSETVSTRADIRALQALANTLTQVEQSKRRILGILTAVESQQLEIARERLAIDRAKTIMPGDDDKEQTGVVYLPAVDIEAYEAEKEAYLQSYEVETNEG